MKRVGFFFDFDKTITYNHYQRDNAVNDGLFSNREYYDGMIECLNNQLRNSLDSSSYIFSGYHIVSRRNIDGFEPEIQKINNELKDDCKIRSLIGAATESYSNNLVDMKILCKHKFLDKTEQLSVEFNENNQKKNIRILWASVKHKMIHYLMKKHDINIGLFYDDDCFNLGLLYGMITNTSQGEILYSKSTNHNKYMKMKESLISLEMTNGHNVSIDGDMRIIPLDIAFVASEIYKSPGIFNHKLYMCNQIRLCLPMMIEMKELYGRYLLKDFDNGKVLMRIYELIYGYRNLITFIRKLSNKNKNIKNHNLLNIIRFNCDILPFNQNIHSQLKYLMIQLLTCHLIPNTFLKPRKYTNYKCQSVYDYFRNPMDLDIEQYYNILSILYTKMNNEYTIIDKYTFNDYEKYVLDNQNRINKIEIFHKQIHNFVSKLQLKDNENLALIHIYLMLYGNGYYNQIHKMIKLKDSDTELFHNEIKIICDLTFNEKEVQLMIIDKLNKH
jgi:hypothetical protein